ncbi:hypothetical protein ACSBR1_040535 [Camellia fascicularis]
MDRGGWNPVLRRRKIDEVLESMTPRDPFTLFNKFGVVKDVIIPMKRRKITRTRFGFVRYDCKVAAEVAVQKADGLWCDNRALKVKMVEYSKSDQRWRYGVEEAVDSHTTYDGKQRAFEVGNGWLYDSLLVKLKAFFSFHDFRRRYKRGM